MNANSKIIFYKKKLLDGWAHGSNHIVPPKQVQGLEFTCYYHQKTNQFKNSPYKGLKTIVTVRIEKKMNLKDILKIRSTELRVTLVL
jgi:hypothetical protein